MGASGVEFKPGGNSRVWVIDEGGAFDLGRLRLGNKARRGDATEEGWARGRIQRE